MPHEIRAAIQRIQANDRKSPIGAILRRPGAVELIAAWPPADLELIAPTTPAPEDPREVWDWIWRHAEIDVAAYVASCGLPAASGIPCFEALVEFRMLYPDGTVAADVRGIASHAVRRHFGLKPKQK